MTKKELQNLHSKRCTIEKVEANVGRGPEERYVVSFSLTAGQLITLESALIERGSPISNDLAAFLRNAEYDAGMERIKLYEV